MVGYFSTKGNYRKTNQDYIGFAEDDKKRIYIVADGMGGHNAGEIASKIAVETALEFINADDMSGDMGNLLIRAIEYSNERIVKYGLENKDLYGMGTTITACLVKDKEMVVANVGDSRCYIIKDNIVIKVTKDHSLVQQLLDEGSINAEEAELFPNKNVITRALGVSRDLEIDTYRIELEGVDKVVLTTDGLTNFISEEDMYEIIMSNDNTEACRKLVKLSLDNGSRDNVSVIIFEGEK